MSATELDADEIRARLLGAGITACRGAYAPALVATIREDIDRAFAAALARPHGVVNRGPHRFYVELHPAEVRAFPELVTHPWFTRVCETMLGPDWTIVELGFDIPFPGARDQPWHRDFPADPEATAARRLTSLAFNLTTVDTTPEMGPFEIAPGTQWELGADWADGMFPPPAEAIRYAALAEAKLPRIGDISVRSALTVHRGTANRADVPRPVLVIGVDAPGAGHHLLHDPQVTPAYHAALPELVRRHLTCRIVDVPQPIIQKHQIDGLSGMQ